jgi:uncharacterized peroxidase-related enzyme
MAWIRTIAWDQAEGRLRTLYERVKGPRGEIDEILQLHALRAHTLEGHMALYKSVLHHGSNQLPKPFLEAIGVHVSRLNRCDYCVDHHSAGLRRVAGDTRADVMLRALADDRHQAAFTPRECAALAYVTLLTLTPFAVRQGDIERLRQEGFDDGEILEINQVASYFAYANRTVLGLGASTANDVLGLSPGNADDPADWSHG